MIGCKTAPSKPPTAQKIVDLSIVNSGGELRKKSTISFSFRGNKYAQTLYNGKKSMSRTLLQQDTVIVDEVSGTDFVRTINNQLVSVSDSLQKVYSNSINSVHYFANLPYGLNDAAVIKEFVGEVIIGNESYFVVSVHFEKAGGGDDFDDIYRYWIHKERFTVDYLAYTFTVNGGGIRFRKAIQPQYVKGIRFVNYENYAPLATSTLESVAHDFEHGKLKLLSTIEIENIDVTLLN